VFLVHVEVVLLVEEDVEDDDRDGRHEDERGPRG
jgi:hypothetical protein